MGTMINAARAWPAFHAASLRLVAAVRINKPFEDLASYAVTTGLESNYQLGPVGAYSALSIENSSPGVALRASQILVRVVNRMALALFVFRMERFARVIPVFFESSVSVMPRLIKAESRWHCTR